MVGEAAPAKNYRAAEGYQCARELLKKEAAYHLPVSVEMLPGAAMMGEC